MRVFLILLLLLSGLSWGRIISLQDYMSENPSLGDNEALYMSSRCSAIFYHMSELNKDRKDLYKNLNKLQTQFLEMSLMLTMKILPDENEEKLYEKTANTINDMIDEYIEVSNTHYEKTGSYLTDIMMTDIEICSSIMK
tara:strand:+ start:51 stop:467 length:417 start_codon:yes stop_codon:yes gene_type:complete